MHYGRGLTPDGGEKKKENKNTEVMNMEYVFHVI